MDNSHGLVAGGGFLTRLVMVFAYALCVPDGLATDQEYASQMVGRQAASDHRPLGAVRAVFFRAVAGGGCVPPPSRLYGTGRQNLILRSIGPCAGEVAVIEGICHHILVKSTLRAESTRLLVCLSTPASSPNGQSPTSPMR